MSLCANSIVITIGPLLDSSAELNDKIIIARIFG